MLDEIKDINASMWISASAGTGKTKSLIDRILALLLQGVEPSKILCLTYTKAAATEMSVRLLQYVRRWSTLSDEELIAELEDMGLESSCAAYARDLCAKAYSANWVSISTIHSFCLDLLERFPLETGLFPNVSVCDEFQYQQLMTEAINGVLNDDTYKTDFEKIAEYECDIQDIIAVFGEDLKRFIDKHDDFASVFGQNFALNSDAEINGYLFSKIFNNEHIRLFSELSYELVQGGKTDIKHAQILAENSKHPTETFVYAVLTQKGTVLKDLCSEKLAYLRPRLERLAEQALQFSDERRQLIFASANASFFRIIKAVFRKFEQLKQMRHYLDYNDIILNASLLLENIDWVMFKTDGGLEHLLVDEAQDTSPAQWRVIKQLTSEFFSNYGSHKTLFIVGDEKQSIYSFQGADVHLFNEMHGYFRKLVEQSGNRFYEISLNKSFRSLGHILSFVDDVFRDSFEVKHDTNREINAGVVDVVAPFFEADDGANVQTANGKIAAYIADYIQYAIDNHVVVGRDKHAAGPSDFLILFQRRDGNLIKLITNTLKERGISASGIDREHIKEELVVEDLIALAEFVVFPLDDLMCARVLKSPIVGMSENDLMVACLSRKDEHLWNYLLNNQALCHKYLHNLQRYVENA